eukprot:6175300-Pleurochrysis_carterae.AAC.1
MSRTPKKGAAHTTTGSRFPQLRCVISDADAFELEEPCAKKWPEQRNKQDEPDTRPCATMKRPARDDGRAYAWVESCTLARSSNVST